MAGPVFAYDGDCAFCTSSAGLLERWVPTPASILPWQFADLDTLGLTVTECEDAVQWVAADGRRAAGPAAVAELLRSSGRRAWRVAGRVLVTRPALALAWPIYRWISRNRHRLPGGNPACAVRRPHPT